LKNTVFNHLIKFIIAKFKHLIFIMFLIKIIIIILFYIPIEEDYGFINSINLGDYINSINSINFQSLK